MWDIQENLLEASTKTQALALPTPETCKAKQERAAQMTSNQRLKATYANKKIWISMEENPKQRQVFKTTCMTLRDNLLENQANYWKKESIKVREEVKELKKTTQKPHQ